MSCISVTNILLPGHRDWYTVPIGGIRTLGSPSEVIVMPLTATSRHIEWSVVDPGTTNATITNSILFMPQKGTAIVRANITQGSCGVDFILDISFTAEESTSPFAFIVEGEYNEQTGEWIAREYDEFGQPTDVIIPVDAVVERT